MRKKIISEIQQNWQDLPSIKSMTYMFNSLLQSDTVHFKEYVKILESEPGLAARVLSVANSPWFKRSKTVQNIDEAAMVIGENILKQIIMAQVTKNVFVTGACTTFDIGTYWRSSLQLAYALLFVVREFNEHPIDSDSAYALGLLHNIGVLFLVHFFPREMNEAFLYAMENSCSLENATLSKLGVSHNEITALVVEQLKLPDIFKEVSILSDDVSSTLLDSADTATFLATLISIVQNWLKEDYQNGIDEIKTLSLQDTEIEQIKSKCLNENLWIEPFTNALAA